MECQVDDVCMHYETIGSGTPIIVLPGWSLSGRTMAGMYEPVFHGLQGWRRIYPDLPGHGRTPPSDSITNVDGILRAVLRFIDTVIPGERFVVASASFGAYLARGVVYQRGYMMDGVMMAVPTTVVEDARRVLPRHEVLVKNPTLGEALPPDGQETWREYVVVQSQAVFESIREGLAVPEDPAAAKWRAGIRDDPRHYSLSFDVDALAAPFPAPALIITGRQDSVVGYAQAWPLLENYPRASFAVLDCAGHFLEVEQPALFAALVHEWLERVRRAQL